MTSTFTNFGEHLCFGELFLSLIIFIYFRGTISFLMIYLIRDFLSYNTEFLFFNTIFIFIEQLCLF